MDGEQIGIIGMRTCLFTCVTKNHYNGIILMRRLTSTLKYMLQLSDNQLRFVKNNNSFVAIYRHTRIYNMCVGPRAARPKRRLAN